MLIKDAAYHSAKRLLGALPPWQLHESTHHPNLVGNKGKHGIHLMKTHMELRALDDTFPGNVETLKPELPTWHWPGGQR